MLSEDGSRRVLRVNVVERPADAGSTFDLVVFVVKAYDTLSAAELLRPALGEQTAVLTLQNGIDNVPMLSSVVGAEHVIGGATWLTAHIAEPGVIEFQDALVRAAIGEPAGGMSDRVETIGSALRACGIETEVSDDINRILWSKIVLLSVHGGMSAACQLPLGDILSTEGMEDVYRGMFNEAVAVGRAVGVDLPDSTSDDLVALLQSAPADNTTSLQVDFGHQRRSSLSTSLERWFAAAVMPACPRRRSRPFISRSRRGRAPSGGFRRAFFRDARTYSGQAQDVGGDVGGGAGGRWLGHGHRLLVAGAIYVHFSHTAGPIARVLWARGCRRRREAPGSWRGRGSVFPLTSPNPASSSFGDSWDRRAGPV